MAPKMKGIVSQSVKDVLQSLVDDGLVQADKIGSCNFFWSFPSQRGAIMQTRLATVKEQQASLQAQVSELRATVEAEKQARPESPVHPRVPALLFRWLSPPSRRQPPLSILASVLSSSADRLGHTSPSSPDNLFNQSQRVSDEPLTINLNCTFPGWNYKPANKIAWGRHRKSCSHAVSSSISQALGKRKAEDVETVLAKRARVKGACYSSPSICPFPASTAKPARPLNAPWAPCSHSAYFVPSVKGALPSQYDPILPKCPPISNPPHQPPATPSPTPSPLEETYRTEPDAFGIFREYTRRPLRDPEVDAMLESVCDAPGLETPPEQEAPKYKSIAWITRSVAIAVNPTSTTPDYGPFTNASQFRLVDYFYGRSDSKSLDALDDLISVIRSPAFSPDDIDGFSAKKAEHALDVWVNPSGVFSEDDGWGQANVEIPLPKTGAKYKLEEAAPKFRSLGSSIDASSHSSKVLDPTHNHFGAQHAACTVPRPVVVILFIIIHEDQPTGSTSASNSRSHAFSGDDPNVEYVVFPLLLWSDATLLANFGTAALWPIYLYIGSLSKYVRGRPTEFAAHHLAVLIAAIRPLACCLCPRCSTPKDKVADAGTKMDLRRRAHTRMDSAALQTNILTARKHLFKGFSINGKRIGSMINHSPLSRYALSAFSTKFSPFGLNFYEILAPDLMHEFELGVWKGIFNHLMRLLVAKGPDAVEEFNSRMRRMPTFGRDRIRRFWHDVLTRKHLAARDYEAFVITIMPAFEGLLDLPDDQTVADLLFALANWHALAKLRLHTAVTLDTFRAATQHMYDAIRSFAKKTCPKYQTRELASEATARVRRAKAANSNTQVSNGRKPVAFTVHHTYMFHSLGDYPDYIERSSPTDNYTTQVGELEHRHIKHFYARTNKVAYEMQIARKERKRTLSAAIREKDAFQPLFALKLDRKRAKIASAEAQSRSAQAAHQKMTRAPSPCPPSDHYAVAKSQSKAIDVDSWLDEHEDDPAIKDFMPLLFDHLLRRLLGREAEPEDGFSQEQLAGIHILNHRLYRHNTIRINYTTYDMQREQDTINPRTHADVTILSPDSDSDDDPYWYARVINIFHANVRYIGPDGTRAQQKWQRVDFLWVRWFERDTSYRAGFQHRRLPLLHFMNANDPDNAPFGFVDPDDVIRAAYLIPAFNHGSTKDLLGPSTLARRLADDGDDDDDYCSHYVCLFFIYNFADRDIYMRHLGGGVGHRGVGINIETSKQHARRIARRGARKKQKGARIANAAPLPQRASSDESGTELSESSAAGRFRDNRDLVIGAEGDRAGEDDSGDEGEESESDRSGNADDEEQHESEAEEREHSDDEGADDGNSDSDVDGAAQAGAESDEDAVEFK
ncbi:hypothetical protein LXA43DRAFT_1097859 [Ganoderma leucocontextum]|nr:hypothetical protein LXA43DRAFT_1097859 [Ganoderma leucocontextum]